MSSIGASFMQKTNGFGRSSAGSTHGINKSNQNNHNNQLSNAQDFQNYMSMA